jgi:hypothetical protein
MIHNGEQTSVQKEANSWTATHQLLHFCVVVMGSRGGVVG